MEDVQFLCKFVAEEMQSAIERGDNELPEYDEYFEGQSCGESEESTSARAGDQLPPAEAAEPANPTIPVEPSTSGAPEQRLHLKRKAPGDNSAHGKRVKFEKSSQHGVFGSMHQFVRVHILLNKVSKLCLFIAMCMDRIDDAIMSVNRFIKTPETVLYIEWGLSIIAGNRRLTEGGLEQTPEAFFDNATIVNMPQPTLTQFERMGCFNIQWELMKLQRLLNAW